jgi:hypothetical protein
MEDYEERFIASLFSVAGTFAVMMALGSRSPAVLYATLLALVSSFTILIIRRRKRR